MARSTFGMRGGLASHVRPIEYLGFGLVANHFDVVPVRANHKRRIVARVVARAQARRTIVFASSLQSPAIESYDKRRGRNRHRSYTSFIRKLALFTKDLG